MARKAFTKGLMLLALVLSGCAEWFTSTVYVPPGAAVRLREPVRGASVWVVSDSGAVVPSKMDLPSGWYVLPDDGEE